MSTEPTSSPPLFFLFHHHSSDITSLSICLDLLAPLTVPKPSSWKSCGLSNLTRSGYWCCTDLSHRVGPQWAFSIPTYFVLFSNWPPSNSPQCFVPNLWSLSNTPAPGSSFKRNNLTTWFTQKTKGRQYKNPWFLFSSPQNHSPSASLCPHFRGRDISLSCQDSFILILSLYPTTPYSLRYDWSHPHLPFY